MELRNEDIMSLSDDLTKKKFDIRLLEWNLINNVISQEEYDKYINSLEDQGSNSEYLDIAMDSAPVPATADGTNLEH